MCWVGGFAGALEEIAVDYCDVAICFVNYVEPPDVGVPGLAWGGLAGNETDAVEAREEAGEALHDGAKGEVGGEEVRFSGGGTGCGEGDLAGEVVGVVPGVEEDG